MLRCSCRLGDGRMQMATVRFSLSVITAIKHRKSIASCQPYPDLAEWSSRVAFRPDVLRARCMLWVCYHLIDMEFPVLFRCWYTIKPLVLPRKQTPQHEPILIKALTTPHNIFVLPFLVIDQVVDLVDVAFKMTPAYVPSMVRHLLTNAGPLVLHQATVDNLDDYFENVRVMDKGISEAHDRACRDAMTTAVKDEVVHRARTMRQVQVDLWRSLEAGFS